MINSTNGWLAAAVLALSLSFCSCDRPQNPEAYQHPGTTRQVHQVSNREVDLITGQDGLTTEQRNIKHRIELDNKPGAMKHLYIVSPTGSCIFYDAIAGKVTSSHKRLYPSYNNESGGTFDHQFNRQVETIGTDGAYGSSTEYIYWWNVNGQYRQLTVGANCTVLVTEVPVRFNEVTIDLSIAPPVNTPAVQKQDDQPLKK